VNYEERNVSLFKKQLIETIDHRIAFGKKLIEAELKSSPLDILVKPIVNAFYEVYSNDARRGIHKQIEIIINCGVKFVKREENEGEFNAEVEKMFPEYLKGDQLSGMCKKSHQNYAKLKAVLKKVFISQIKESMILINVKDDIDDYNGLVRAAFKNREEAYRTLITQLNSYDECLRIMERDLSILTFPAGRRRIFNVLKRGSEESNKDFIRNLDMIYY
jgi:hypothetical protein